MRSFECPPRGAHLLNDLRVLIRRCRIKAAFNTSSDNGFELRVRHMLRNCGDGGLELSRYQRCNQYARTRGDASAPLSSALACRKLAMHHRDPHCKCPLMTQSGHRRQNSARRLGRVPPLQILFSSAHAKNVFMPKCTKPARLFQNFFVHEKTNLNFFWQRVSV
jgi:hypothetical protein